MISNFLFTQLFNLNFNAMRKTAFFLMFIATIVVSTVFVACDKDDEPVDLTLKTLVAGSIDLNGSTSPTNVPLNPTITATFSTAVDATTATAANIKLMQDYDDADIPLSITVNGAVVTITPQSDLGSGTLYMLSFSAALKSTEGKFLTALTRNFTTTGSFSPSGVVAYWTFEDNANDVVGNYDPATTGIVDITYTAGRKTAAGKAATFNGTTSIIEVPDGDQLMNTNDFTLSFWVKAVSEGITHGHFVMGLGAFYGFQFEIFGDYSGCKLAASYNVGDTNAFGEDLWFPANGNVEWQGWTYCADLTSSGGLQALIKDTWAHVVCTYNSSTKEGVMYINGEKMKSQDFDLWPTGDLKTFATGMKYRGVAPDVVNELAFGFIQSRAGTMWDSEPWGGYDFPEANHFKGQLDDIRIFHKAITATEVQLMYNSEKP